MKIFKIVIGFISILILSGCTKEKMTTLVGILYNKSGKKVEFKPYRAGVLVTEQSFILNLNDSMIIGYSSHLGDFKDYGFDSEYVNNSIDSIVIAFEDGYSITHYKTLMTEPSEKYFLPEYSRNIFNGANYDLEKIRSKKEWVNYNRYIFSESDYEYAKD